MRPSRRMCNGVAVDGCVRDAIQTLRVAKHRDDERADNGTLWRRGCRPRLPRTGADSSGTPGRRWHQSSMVAITPSSTTPRADAYTFPTAAGHATAAPARPRLFGQWLVDRGEITNSDLREALALMRAVNSTIGELAVAHGLVSAAQAEEINELQRHVDGRWGDIAIALGVGRATAARIEELAWAQQIENLRLSDALVELGFVTATTVDQMLRQFEDERDNGTTAGSIDDDTRARIEDMVEGLPRLLHRVLGTAVRMSPPRVADGTRLEHCAQINLGGTGAVGITAERRVARAVADALRIDVSGHLASRLDTAIGALLVLFGGQLARRQQVADESSRLSAPPVAGCLPSARWAVDLALADGSCVLLIER